jgi:hypothetical protein
MAKVETTLEDLDEIHAANSATRLMAGETFVNGRVLVTDWDTAEVSNWLVSIGYKDLVPIFQRSNINGVALGRLSERTLHEIGILNVGTRLQFMNEVVKVQAISRSAWRNAVVWKDQEYRPNWCFYMCPDMMNCSKPTGGICCLCTSSFCCHGIMWTLPQAYTLTHGRLNVLSEIYRLGKCGCPYWSVESNNLDLAQIIDIDCTASTAHCGDPAGIIEITSLDGKTLKLTLPSQDSQKVTHLLHNIKDEALVTVRMINPGQNINRS